jgi:hypothetical protein
MEYTYRDEKIQEIYLIMQWKRYIFCVDIRSLATTKVPRYLELEIYSSLTFLSVPLCSTPSGGTVQ